VVGARADGDPAANQPPNAGTGRRWRNAACLPPNCSPRRPPGRGRPHLGVSGQTVGRWPSAGRPTAPPAGSAVAHRAAPQVSDAQLEQAAQALLKGAKAHGFASDRWTLDRIAEVIWGVTGCVTTPRRCGGCCAIGWTGACNAPAGRAQERDEQAIRRWVASDGPGAKKRQAPHGRHLLLRRVRGFADPVVRSTWAPRGKTRCWSIGATGSVLDRAGLCFGSDVAAASSPSCPARQLQPRQPDRCAGRAAGLAGWAEATVLWDGLAAIPATSCGRSLPAGAAGWWWSDCPARP
jgi:hypothetical protein